MTDQIRNASLQRFEAANADVLEEIELIMAAESDSPAAYVESHVASSPSRLARWFRARYRTDLAA